MDAEQLLHSLGLSGTADPAALLCKLRKLRGVRQQGVLNNAAAVATHLLSPAVGLTTQQVGQLLERCPVLFSWPAEQRAAVLFGELMTVGLTAAAAAACFVAYPTAAACSALTPGIAEAAAILAHSDDGNCSLVRKAAVPAAERTVAALLSRIPSALKLLCQSAGYLQQRAAELQQAGFTAADVAALVWWQPEVLSMDAAAAVASRAALVQQELGVPAAQVVSLVARRRASWVSCSVETVQGRAAALAEVSGADGVVSGQADRYVVRDSSAGWLLDFTQQNFELKQQIGTLQSTRPQPMRHPLPVVLLQVFGKAAAADMLLRFPGALECAPAVWHRNLCYMAACSVADPKAVLLKRPRLLYLDQAAPSFLQRRLLLQWAFRLTAAQLYVQQPSYLDAPVPQALAQRLQYVEHRGQAHRLVAKASRGRKPATASAEERQPALSMAAVTNTWELFLPAVGASQAQWEAWAAANPPAACPLFAWAQQAAAEEAARLAAALPPELAQLERQPHPRFG